MKKYLLLVDERTVFKCHQTNYVFREIKRSTSSLLFYFYDVFWGYKDISVKGFLTTHIMCKRKLTIKVGIYRT